MRFLTRYRVFRLRQFYVVSCIGWTGRYGIEFRVRRGRIHQIGF